MKVQVTHVRDAETNPDHIRKYFTKAEIRREIESLKTRLASTESTLRERRPSGPRGASYREERDVLRAELAVFEEAAKTLDGKWTATYTARKKDGTRVEFTATVEASDNYEANDKIKELAEKKFGPDLYYPVIRVKGGPKRLEAGSVSQRVAAAAGAEED